MKPFMGRRGLAGSGHDVWRVLVLTDFLDGEHCTDTATGSEGAVGAGGAAMQCFAMVLSVYAADRSSGVSGNTLGVSSMIPMGWVACGPEPGGQWETA